MEPMRGQEATPLEGAAARWPGNPAARFRLRDLCRRLGVAYRDARCVCEKDWLPPGVAPAPGRGNHCALTPRQAVGLGIVLKLKACGMRAATAARVAAVAERVKGWSRNAGWDWRFSPFDGAFDTDQAWYVEVGDLPFLRFSTDANPSWEGLDHTPWVDMDTGRTAAAAAPVVLVQVDLSALARLLQDPPG